MSPRRDHRRFQALAGATLLVGLLPAALAASVENPLQLAGAFFGWSAGMYLFAALGTTVAAFTYGRGETMRPAWLLISASYLVLVPALVRSGPRAGGLYQAVERAPWVSASGSIVSGVLAVGGFLLLSRAWRASGLDTTSRAARLMAQLAALAVGAALAGPGLLEQLPAALRGDVLAAGDVVTDLLDVALLVVAIPVLRAALGLGGGLVAWPWIMLSASLLAWLGYDATAINGAVVGLDPRTGRVVDEVFRTLAAGFAFAAGLAQRWVMTDRPPDR